MADNNSGLNLNIDSVNDVTNELILKYDSKFNELYDKILNVNSSIMNKEELIIKADEEIAKKEITILALELLVFFVILFGVLLILYAMKKIDFKKLRNITICLFILYSIVTWYYLYSAFNNKSISDKLKALEVGMKEYAYDSSGSTSNLQCPTTCPRKTFTPPTRNTSTIVSYATPTLKTDSQSNVWEYGDMPVDLYTTSKNPASKFYTAPHKRIKSFEKTDPKPSFGTTYPSSTYYECEWLGGSINGGLPNVESKKYSSIPCDYRPNFTEKNRYICTKNPNNLDSDQFKKVCNDVSNMV